MYLCKGVLVTETRSPRVFRFDPHARHGGRAGHTLRAPLPARPFRPTPGGSTRYVDRVEAEVTPARGASLAGSPLHALY